MEEFSKEELDKQQEIIEDFKQEFKTKSITFDKDAQENLPQHIKDKMKADRENARKKQLTIHSVSKSLNADELIASLGMPDLDNEYIIKPDKYGKWQIEHKHVGSGEPLRQWLTGKP